MKWTGFWRSVRRSGFCMKNKPTSIRSMTTSPCEVCSSVREILFVTFYDILLFSNTLNLLGNLNGLQHYIPLSLFLRLIPSLTNISSILLQGRTCSYRWRVGTFSHFLIAPGIFTLSRPSSITGLYWSLHRNVKRYRPIS